MALRLNDPKTYVGAVDGQSFAAKTIASTTERRCATLQECDTFRSLAC